jgi:hypothetical protein
MHTGEGAKPAIVFRPRKAHHTGRGLVGRDSPRNRLCGRVRVFGEILPRHRIHQFLTRVRPSPSLDRRRELAPRDRSCRDGTCPRLECELHPCNHRRIRRHCPLIHLSADRPLIEPDVRAPSVSASRRSRSRDLTLLGMRLQQLGRPRLAIQEPASPKGSPAKACGTARRVTNRPASVDGTYATFGWTRHPRARTLAPFGTAHGLLTDFELSPAISGSE